MTPLNSKHLKVKYIITLALLSSPGTSLSETFFCAHDFINSTSISTFTRHGSQFIKKSTYLKNTSSHEFQIIHEDGKSLYLMGNINSRGTGTGIGASFTLIDKLNGDYSAIYLGSVSGESSTVYYGQCIKE
jgi:hypothetical protein